MPSSALQFQPLKKVPALLLGTLKAKADAEKRHPHDMHMAPSNNTVIPKDLFILDLKTICFLFNTVVNYLNRSITRD